MRWPVAAAVAVAATAEVAETVAVARTVTLGDHMRSYSTPHSTLPVVKWQVTSTGGSDPINVKLNPHSSRK